MKTWINCAIFSLLFLTTEARSEWSLRPQVGLAATSNANLEETDKDADIYAWIRGSAFYFGDTNSYNFWVSYRAYISESDNDVFNFQASFTRTVAWFDKKNWELELTAGGQTFTNESPGITEQSFDYFFGRFGLLKTISFRSDLELVIEPSYELRPFTEFDGRLDHDLSLRSELAWTYRPRFAIEPFAGIGVTRSNQELYTRSYFELGTDWNWLMNRRDKIELGILARFSTYPNRLVSQTTVVTNKRGRSVPTSQDENESQKFTQLGGAFVRMNKSNELRASVTLNNNDSKSGAVDYSEAVLAGSATFSF